MKQKLASFAYLLIGAALAIGLSEAMAAWTPAPATGPTNASTNNTEAPINVGLTGQSKSGVLAVGGMTILGAFQLTTGAGSNKFLTSDASGFASWTGAVVESCPAGFTAMSDEYCIQSTQNASQATWFNAVASCVAQNAHLCSFAEWNYACTQGVSNMVGVSNEWVEDHDQGPSYGAAGFLSCNDLNYNAGSLTNEYRCCINR